MLVVKTRVYPFLAMRRVVDYVFEYVSCRLTAAKPHQKPIPRKVSSTGKTVRERGLS
jgi:hypothetical protein